MNSHYKIDIQYLSDDDKRHFEHFLDEAIEQYAMGLKVHNAGELTITKL